MNFNYFHKQINKIIEENHNNPINTEINYNELKMICIKIFKIYFNVHFGFFPLSHIVVWTSCVNWRQLISIDVNWRQLTFIDVMLTFVNMTSCVIFHHGWRQLTSIDDNWLDASDMMFFDAHDVFWFFLTFFDVYWRFLKFQKISKNFWRKLTLASI